MNDATAISLAAGRVRRGNVLGGWRLLTRHAGAETPSEAEVERLWQKAVASANCAVAAAEKARQTFEGIYGRELACIYCELPLTDWPTEDCQEPRTHTATVECACGESLTFAEAVDERWRHSRCRTAS